MRGEKAKLPDWVFAEAFRATVTSSSESDGGASSDHLEVRLNRIDVEAEPVTVRVNWAGEYEINGNAWFEDPDATNNYLMGMFDEIETLFNGDAPVWHAPAVGYSCLLSKVER